MFLNIKNIKKNLTYAILSIVLLVSAITVQAEDYKHPYYLNGKFSFGPGAINFLDPPKVTEVDGVKIYTNSKMYRKWKFLYVLYLNKRN